MPQVDYRHLPILGHPEKPLLSLDQVLLEIKGLSVEAPGIKNLQKRSCEINREIKELGQTVLNMLVPNLARLEKKYGSNPEVLQAKVEAEITKSMVKLLSKKDRENIAKALGIDPDRFTAPEQFQEMLSKAVYKALAPTGTLADIVILLTSGNLLELLSKTDTGLSAKFKKLLRQIEEALDEYASVLDFRPAPSPSPEPAAPRPRTEACIPQEILALFVRKEDVVDTLRSEKKSSLFDVIAQACKDLGLAREHEHQKHKLEEAQQDESEETNRKRVEDFIAHNPEFADALKALLDDQHFTDAPLTQYARLLALERAEKLKLA